MTDQMIPRCEAVLFDMDGLLVDSEPVYQRAWTDAVAHIGFELTNEMFLQLLGRGRKGALQKMQEFFGEVLPVDKLNTELSMREARYFQETPPPPRKGALELLDFLEQRKIPTAVATSTRSPIAQERLARCGIAERFLAIVTVDQVERGKPAPDIFLKAAADLNRDPSVCIVLEDSEQGVRAARDAGMYAVLVPDLLAVTPEIKKVAHSVFADLLEVRDWLGTKVFQA